MCPQKTHVSTKNAWRGRVAVLPSELSYGNAYAKHFCAREPQKDAPIKRGGLKY